MSKKTLAALVLTLALAGPTFAVTRAGDPPDSRRHQSPIARIVRFIVSVLANEPCPPHP
jgi:hypothetical protein